MAVAAAQTIYLIACHTGTANHFIDWRQELIASGHEVRILASGPALKRFEACKIPVFVNFDLEGLSNDEEIALAQAIIKTCSLGNVVITGVATSLEEKIQLGLEGKGVALYENPERFVPGGYSSVAAKVMAAAGKVWVANKHLVQGSLYSDLGVDCALPQEKRFGIGFYPLQEAGKIKQLREEQRVQQRAAFLAKSGIVDVQQKVMGYFGGNNAVYFEHALPAFLAFLSESIQAKDLSDCVIVMQQHPGAAVKNIDRELIASWIGENQGKPGAPRVVFSDQNSSDLQVMIDAALYFQTTLNIQFAIAGIPFFQVGHESYLDVCVEGGLCVSVTDAQRFMGAIRNLEPVVFTEERRREIDEKLGLDPEWQHNLKNALELKQH